MEISPETAPEPLFTTEEILDCLKVMNPNKSPGPDHLTSDICLMFAKLYPSTVTSIMNRCLELKYFPKIWKEAYIKIIPKPNKSDYSDTAAYRPIGLINVFGKLLEKLIIQRITHHITSNNLACNNQYGFKEQSSTVHALKKAIDTVKQSKTNNEHVIAISLDIQSAFNNAWWPLIFKRLHKIKCPKNLYDIMKSYVQDRKAQIDFADSSATKTLTRGCIQGSVCGPTCWNLILDELLESKLPEGCHLLAFADDVTLIVHDKNLEILQNKTNQALEMINKWGFNAKLTFGPQKTQAIAFTKKAEKSVLKFNNHQVHFKNTIKLLGITIDKKLNFTQHVKSVIDKAQNIYQKLIRFVRPTWGIHGDNIATIYKQVIEPIICYASSIWHDAIKFECVRKKLLSLQRGFAIKIVRGFRTLSTAASISLANLIPLPAKILETAEIESTRITGISKFLPQDITLDGPAQPSTILHPANRVKINFNIASEHKHIEEHVPPHSYQIYTDGSKTDGNVGAAFVVYYPDGRKIIKKFKLHKCCSIFQAELLAINKACHWILLNKVRKSVILSDSQSGLIELNNRYSRNRLASEIQAILYKAKCFNYAIDFVWVKGHAGIIGNEEADVAAKSAAMCHNKIEYSMFPLSHIKTKCQTISQQAANDLYMEINNCRYTKKWCPTYEILQKVIKCLKPNFQLTQIFTNHGFHKEYLHRFKIVNNDRCPCDNCSIQSIEHLIMKCPKYGTIRQKHEIMSSILKVAT